jgi:hypothetical protein
MLKTHTLAVLLLLSTAAAASADDAATSTNPFTITLPAGYGEFAKQVQTAKSPEGEIETTNWVSKAPTGEAVVVTMSRMPGKILDPGKLIASTRDSLLKSLGATLETEDEQGVRFSSPAAFFQARFNVVGDRFYQVLYVGRSAEQRTAPAVGQLFGSFQIE